MEKDLDPEVIKSTQNSLGKFVKRPPLTEKLLKKPPFRFLHDVITTVLKTTGFFENLFDEEELISDKVKDREGKISFLNKVIFVISATTGKSLSAKSSKIVAGQEPEKTNELLQCLAQALEDKLTSDKAVQQYKDRLNASKPTDTKTKDISKAIKKGNDTKKLASRSSEKLTSQKNDVTRTTTKQDKDKSNDVQSKRKDNGTDKREVQSVKKIQQTKTVVKKNGKEQKDVQKHETSQTRRQIETPRIEKDKTSNSIEKESIGKVLSQLQSQDLDVSIEKENHSDNKLNDVQTNSLITMQNNENNLNGSYTIAANDLNSSSHLNLSSSSNGLMETPHINTSENKTFENKNITEIPLSDTDDQHQENIDHNETSLKSLDIDINVSSETKAASATIKKEPEYKTIGVIRQDSLNAAKVSNINGNDAKIPLPPSGRPASVRPSSSRPGAPRMREKVDNVVKETDNFLMGKVNIIVENTQNEGEEDNSPVVLDQTETTAVSQDQQELQLSSSEHGHLVQQILDSQKELHQISGKTEIEWQFGAQKAREAMNQDVEQLRFNIQALSRVANPLGKLLDHIQEDVEVMRQELQQWSTIYDEVNKEMLKQKTINEDSLTPFHSKLKQLESDIEEKHDKINDLKIMIHKNANRIEKLLTSGNVQ